MELSELTSYSPAALAEISALLGQLSPGSSLTREGLEAVISQPGSHLYVLRSGERIIGCATLCVYSSPTGRKASVEDVVVSSEFRGQHLGRRLMEYVLEQARTFAPIELHLTSRPSRVAANALYRSLGFSLRETNAYNMILNENY